MRIGPSGGNCFLMWCKASSNRVRTRRLHPIFKDAVVKEASSSSTGGRTNAAVVEALQRHRKLRVRISPKGANAWTVGRASQYYQKSRAAFQDPRVKVISLAADGTRVGGADTFLCSMCSPETGAVCWAPPQAPDSREESEQPECPNHPSRRLGQTFSDLRKCIFRFSLCFAPPLVEDRAQTFPDLFRLFQTFSDLFRLFQTSERTKFQTEQNAGVGRCDG